MAGLTTNFTNYEELTGGRSQNVASADLPIPNDPDKWWISSIGDTASATNGGSQYRKFTMSYLFRALYNYNRRYLVNFSFRRDGASVFKYTGNTWDNFYSVGAGWIMSEENFMRNQHVIDYLKIKGSYGVLGNQNVGTEGGNYPAFPTLNSSNAIFGDNIISSYAQAYLATNLRWEKTKAWEVGFEMQMFNQRLHIEPTYYSKKTEDLICYLESFMGAQDGLINSGSIRNRGFELSGSWSDTIGDDFRYTVSGNLTTIDNEVLTLGKTYYQGDKSVAVSEPGKPIGYFYGYEVEGIYQNKADIASSPENTLAAVAPGDLKFRDVTGDGKITEADRTMIGNPTPDFTYGYSVNLQYKNFDLGIDFQGVYGNEIFNTSFLSAYAQYNYHTKRLGRWNGEGTSNWGADSRFVARHADDEFELLHRGRQLPASEKHPAGLQFRRPDPQEDPSQSAARVHEHRQPGHLVAQHRLYARDRRYGPCVRHRHGRHLPHADDHYFRCKRVFLKQHNQ